MVMEKVVQMEREFKQGSGKQAQGNISAHAVETVSEQLRILKWMNPMSYPV